MVCKRNSNHTWAHRNNLQTRLQLTQNSAKLCGFDPIQCTKLEVEPNYELKKLYMRNGRYPKQVTAIVSCFIYIIV
jgi:hypothetical protein